MFLTARNTHTIIMVILPFFLLALSASILVSANLTSPITASPPIPPHIFARQDITSNVSSICGYGRKGDGWSAPPSSKCMVDTEAGYFGFCPLSKSHAKDCGFARACVDLHTCTTRNDGSGGCGKMGDQPYGTMTCTNEAEVYCYTNLLLATISDSNNPPSSPTTTTLSFIGCAKASRQGTYSIAPGLIPSASASASASSSPSPQSPSTQKVPALPSTTTNVLPTPDASKPSSSINTGAIIGEVLGGIAIVAITGLMFYLLRKRYSSRQFSTLSKGGSESQSSTTLQGIISQPVLVEADAKPQVHELSIPPVELPERSDVVEIGAHTSVCDRRGANTLTQ